MQYITLFGMPHPLCNLFERYFKFIMHQGIRVPGSYLFQHALKFKCRLFIQMLVIKTIFKIMVLTFLRICELSVAKVMAKLRKHMHVCMQLIAH